MKKKNNCTLGTSGAEAIVVTINKRGFVEKIKIDKNIINVREINAVEELIIKALKNAKKSILKKIKSKIKKTKKRK